MIARPSVSVDASAVMVIGAIALVAGAGAWIYFKHGAAIKRVVSEDLNPASDKNLAYAGASSVVSKVAGREESVGTWIYGLFHDEPDLRAPVETQPKVNVEDELAGGVLGVGA